MRDAADPPPGPFDVVAAVQLLMHVADPVAVLPAAARSGAVVVGDGVGPRAGVRRQGPRRGARPVARAASRSTPSSVADPARLLALAERAGLRVDRLDEVAVPFDYADEDGLLGPLLGLRPGPGGRPPGRSGRGRAAVLDRLSPYRSAAGGYRLTNLFRVLVARPASPRCPGSASREGAAELPVRLDPSRVSRARRRCSGTCAGRRPGCRRRGSSSGASSSCGQAERGPALAQPVRSAEGATAPSVSSRQVLRADAGVDQRPGDAVLAGDRGLREELPPQLVELGVGLARRTSPRSPRARPPRR